MLKSLTLAAVLAASLMGIAGSVEANARPYQGSQSQDSSSLLPGTPEYGGFVPAGHANR